MRQFTRVSTSGSAKPRELMTPEDGTAMMAADGAVHGRHGQVDAVSAPASLPPASRTLSCAQAFPMVFGPESPMIVYLMFLPGMDHGDCGVPEGGSLEFARAIERRYRTWAARSTTAAGSTKILVAEESAARGRSPAAARRASAWKTAASITPTPSSRRPTATPRCSACWTTSSCPTSSGGYYGELPIFSRGHPGLAGHQPRPVGRAARDTLPARRARDHRRPSRATSLPIRHYCYDPSMAPAGKSVVTSS